MKPDLDYLRETISLLKKAEEEYIKKYGKANAMMSNVFLAPTCGTPGCHAGWLAIARPELKIGRYNFSQVAENFIKRLFIGQCIEYWGLIHAPGFFSVYYDTVTMSEIFSRSEAISKNAQSGTVSLSEIIERWEAFLAYHENN